MELLVVMAIVSIVAVSAGSMLVSGMRTFQARHVGNMVVADMRFAMEVMARDLRTARSVTLTSLDNTRDITFFLPGDSDTQPRGFDLRSGTIWRVNPNVADSAIAANVHSLLFEISDRNIVITLTSVREVDGIAGSGLPLILTTRVMRRN